MSAPWTRGNDRPLRPQAESSGSASANPSVAVADVTARLYQPTRVLMSVLFIPQAATRTSTSPGPGEGTGTSSRTSSISGPPVPSSRAARITAGTSTSGTAGGIGAYPVSRCERIAS